MNKIFMTCGLLMFLCSSLFAQPANPAQSTNPAQPANSVQSANTQPAGSAQSSNDELIFRAMRQEIERGMNGLRLQNYTHPYHIGYVLTHTESASVSASLGVVTSDRYTPGERAVGGAIYTGDYELNSNGNYQPPYNFTRTAKDNYEGQIRRDLWLLSDGLYKSAASAYQNKEASLKRQNVEKTLPDMLRTEAVTLVDPSDLSLNADREEYRKVAKDLSAIFLDYPQLYNSGITISAVRHTTYMVNSEKSTIKQPIVLYGLSMRCTIDTPDGIEISDSKFELFPSKSAMPSTAEMRSAVDQFAKKMSLLGNAPEVKEHYFGPVLFEDAAVVSILTNVFLSPSALLGYRKPVDAESGGGGGGGGFGNRMGGGGGAPGGGAQAIPTLADRVGKRIVDSKFTVKNLTNLHEYQGKKLVGAYSVDIEGVVPPPSVTLIENGLFRRTLNSRIPTDISSESTGSLRYGVGTTIAIMPGVLHISASGGEKMDKLHKKLFKGATEEGNNYAYIVRKLSPEPEIYLVDIKTGKETRVHNATISNVTLNKLRRVMGVSNKEQVVNVQINSSIPASIICPTAILVEDIEITPRETNKEQLFFTKNPLVRTQ